MVDYIGDRLVEFHTAKILEEAGYNDECIYVCSYSNDGNYSEPYKYGGVKTHGVKLEKFKTVMVPTQTAAMKWLRENGFPGAHCTYISSDHGTAWIPGGVHGVVGNLFGTYEDCAEYVISECAKLKAGCNTSKQ